MRAHCSDDKRLIAEWTSRNSSRIVRLSRKESGRLSSGIFCTSSNSACSTCKSANCAWSRSVALACSSSTAELAPTANASCSSRSSTCSQIAIRWLYVQDKLKRSSAGAMLIRKSVSSSSATTVLAWCRVASTNAASPERSAASARPIKDRQATNSKLKGKATSNRPFGALTWEVYSVPQDLLVRPVKLSGGHPCLAALL